MNDTDPIIPDRWARQVGAAMLYAAFWVALLAAATVSIVMTAFFLMVAAGLMIGGAKLARRERW
jgi:hypothetical protein